MSTDLVIYQNDTGDIHLDITLTDENIWLSQAQLCEVFQRSKATISEHISHIFDEGEVDARAVVRNFRTTANDAKTYDVKYYNLDMVIALGYRVKSPQGTQFRIWATQKLKEYITKGFVLDDERFKRGDSMGYFDELQNRLRDIRISERFFYQKIKDIYTTSIDYNPKDDKTIRFFQTVQNKLLWAISSQTAAELVHSRVDISLPLLGMQSFDKEKKSLTKKDVSIAKNYLNEEEMKLLGLLVEQYLAFAETMAQQRTPMYMKDWIERLDAIISLNGRELLTHAGKISHKLAQEKSETVYKTYKDEQKVLHQKSSIKELEADIKKIVRH